MREQEGICRGWVRQVARNVGPVQDVPAPDVMTSGQHMIWMLDEYEKIMGGKYPGFITGKPLGVGGSLGRTEATGHGVIFTVREALRELGIDIKKTTAAIQGFGNVAQYALRLYTEYGGTVVCVSCWDETDQKSYTYRKSSGVKFEELLTVTDRFGGIDKKKAQDLRYELLPGNAWIEQEVDILMPAAIENQLTAETAPKIGKGVKMIAEGANGPSTIEADEIIKKRNIFLLPDFLANAGGVTCSYFEQVQCNMNFFWTKDEVLRRLDEKMTDAYIKVAALARDRKVLMRDAAYMIAIQRVAEACKLRGWV